MAGMATMELPVRRKGSCCELELPADQGWAVESARLLKALADPTRVAMVWCLRRAQAQRPLPGERHRHGRAAVV